MSTATGRRCPRHPEQPPIGSRRLPKIRAVASTPDDSLRDCRDAARHRRRPPMRV